MIKIKEIKIHGLSIPFKKNIQTTWSKRSGTTIFLIELITSNNIKGYGEMISFFKSDISKMTLERMVEDIKGFNLFEINKMKNRAIYGGGWMRTGHLNDLGSAAWAGLETAIYDAICKEKKMPLQDFFGGEIKNDFKVSVNVDVEDVKSMCKNAKKLVAKGYKTLFIKVAKNSKSLNQDIEMLLSIQKVVGKKISLHIDANGAWTIQTAIRAIKLLEKHDLNIYCIEQPVMDMQALKSLRKKTKYPIAVNELLYSPQNIIDCAKNEIADIFVLDIFEFGGVTNLWYLSKFLTDSGYSVACRAHGGSNISYLTSLKILAASNSNKSTNSNQLYDFNHKEELLEWNTSIKDGQLVVNSLSDIGVKINKNLFNKYKKNYDNGIVYEIYKNNKKKKIPGFPKY